MKVTLTFDNGPDPDITPRVLTILRNFGVRATFFVIGSQVKKHGTDLLRAMLEDGHQIGNHTFTHETPLGLIPGERGIEEITQTESLLDTVDAGMRLFRPFGRASLGPHLMSRAVWEYLGQAGFGCVLWNIVGYEWEREKTWVEPAVAQCVANPHSVVGLHDIYETIPAHLERFLEKLSASGAQFSEDFPVSCVPMWGGRPQWPQTRISGIVTSDSTTVGA